MRPFFLNVVDTKMVALADDLRQARRKLFEYRSDLHEVMVMEEMVRARPVHLLERGDYDAPKTEETRVARDVPSFLLPFRAGALRDRRGLAQWLTDPRHPLTARVAVDRIWQMFFGRGLVGTSEDFGVQGGQPTQPALLDWLARGPSRRLSAEMIRDTALAASELLNGKRGGPPVGPYQPPGLWREANSMSPAYEESVGRELYRRSLYTV